MPTAVFAAADVSSVLNGSSGGLVPCEGFLCRACDLVTLANNVINFGVGFSVVVATLMFAYAGILYTTAATSGPEQIKKAHKVFGNIFVGLILVLTAWLIVDLTLSVLSGRGIAIWSNIKCDWNPTTAAFPTVSAPPSGSSPIAGGPAAGAIPPAVCAAAKAYQASGISTAVAGTGCSLKGGGTAPLGRCACAYAVNQVLGNAGVSPLDNNLVKNLETQLQSGRGTQVNPAQAVCGDIVVAAGDQHVGICLNTGCTQVVSNSSNSATFTGVGGTSLGYSGQGRVYQINN